MKVLVRLKALELECNNSKTSPRKPKPIGKSSPTKIKKRFQIRPRTILNNTRDINNNSIDVSDIDIDDVMPPLISPNTEAPQITQVEKNFLIKIVCVCAHVHMCVQAHASVCILFVDNSRRSWIYFWSRLLVHCHIATDTNFHTYIILTVKSRQHNYVT